MGNIRARKRFGQHFLTDHSVIRRIVEAIAPRSDDALIEIGPGRGALTGPLLQMVSPLTAVEIDRDCVAYLRKQFPQKVLNIIAQDVLKVNFSDFSFEGKSIRVVGNLPYNISTPLLFHLFQFSRIIHDLHFMLQKEVAQRMAARINTSHYGRLSVMVQYYTAVSVLFEVPPVAFSPPPRVDSAVVRLKPYKKLPHKATNEELFSEVVKQAFNHRRKTLANALKNMISKEELTTLNISHNARPESLTVADFVHLSNYLVTTLPSSRAPPRDPGISVTE